MKKTIHSKEHRVLISLLRKIREERGFTQSQLAKLIESDQTFISKIENSERRIDLIELRIICNALNQSFLEFVQILESKLKDY